MTKHTWEYIIEYAKENKMTYITEKEAIFDPKSEIYIYKNGECTVEEHGFEILFLKGLSLEKQYTFLTLLIGE